MDLIARAGVPIGPAEFQPTTQNDPDDDQHREADPRQQVTLERVCRDENAENEQPEPKRNIRGAAIGGDEGHQHHGARNQQYVALGDIGPVRHQSDRQDEHPRDEHGVFMTRDRDDLAQVAMQVTA